MRSTPRNLARLAGLPRFSTGRPCRNGHLAERYVSTGHCVVCSAERGAEKYARDGAQMRAYHNGWRRRNAGKVNAKNRRYQLPRHMPAWADRLAIRAIYEEAARLSAESGIRHSVDHVIPLHGECVSGLHVAENLQILTFVDNVRKSNHFAA